MNSYEKVRRLSHQYRVGIPKRKERKTQTAGKKREKIISIADIHGVFCREDLIEKIVKEHSGADYCVVNGDLFDNYLISKFPKNKEIPIAAEYVVVSELVATLSSHFGKVILVDGNHDSGRFASELSKLSDSIKFLMKTSPLKYVADGMIFSETGEDLGRRYLPNVTYAGDTGTRWWTRVGKTIFAHRLKRARTIPMGNAIAVAEWLMNNGIQFQCLVSAHTHKVGMIEYKGKLLIDQGALCLPMEYEEDGGCIYKPIDLGYAVVEMDRSGNVDRESTRYVYLGTYQEA